LRLRNTPGERAWGKVESRALEHPQKKTIKFYSQLPTLQGSVNPDISEQKTEEEGVVRTL